VVGTRYKLKGLRVKGFVKVAVSSTNASALEGRMVRLLLVKDSQPNGAQAQGEDIMQDFGSGVNNLESFVRVSEGAGMRYSILSDQFLALDAEYGARANTLATDPIQNTVSWQPKQFKFSWKPTKPVEVQVKSGNATPTVAGLVNCNIFMLAFGIDAAGSSIATVVNGASRAYFCD